MTESPPRDLPRTDRPELRRELLALRLRARLAVGLWAFGLATLTIAVVLCSACVAARMFATSFPPTPWWALGLLPALGYALWQVRRRDLDLHALAAHVDRRTGSRGLLLATRDAEAGAWGVMSAYNRLGGEFCAANDRLLNRILRGEYTHRGAEAKSRPLGEEFSAAKDHYASEFREAASSVTNAARQAAERARDAFRDAQRK